MKTLTPGRAWLVAVFALIIGLAAGLAFAAIQHASLTAELRDAEQASISAEEDLASLEASLSARIADLESQLASATDEAARQSDPHETPAPDVPSDVASPEILERTVDPETVDPSDPVTFRVRVSGDADSVSIRVVARAGEFDETFALERVPGSGDVRLWEAVVDAPDDPGEYRYFATATLGNATVEMPGVSGWSFLVR